LVHGSLSVWLTEEMDRSDFGRVKHFSAGHPELPASLLSKAKELP